MSSNSGVDAAAVKASKEIDKLMNQSFQNESEKVKLLLRKILHPMDELAAMEFLYDKLKATKTNGEFFDAMKSK